MHGKIYPSMYTGSMVGAGAMAFALMPYCIANARVDEDSCLDLNPTLLSTVFGEEAEKIVKAIEFLCSPDPKSRCTAHDGRRLLKVGPGPFRYQVVNLEHYRQNGVDEERTEYWAQYKAWQRKGKPGGAFKYRPRECPQELWTDLDKCGLSNSVHTADAGADAGTVLKGSSIPYVRKRPETLEILDYLNSKCGRSFRPVEANLRVIGSRLAELGVNLVGVKQMIDRQCSRWKGTEQEEYLRPETLFAKSKFDSYYAAKDMPVKPANESHAQTPGDKMIYQKEFERLVDRMRQIKNGYGEVQTWSTADVMEYTKLRVRKNELKKILGIVI